MHLFRTLLIFVPLLNLNLTSASSEISNHGLETTVYIALDGAQLRQGYELRARRSSDEASHSLGVQRRDVGLILGTQERQPRVEVMFSTTKEVNVPIV